MVIITINMLINRILYEFIGQNSNSMQSLYCETFMMISSKPLAVIEKLS